jgi:hypothetical protein
MRLSARAVGEVFAFMEVLCLLQPKRRCGRPAKGVGKSTVSAPLVGLAARNGMSVLLVEDLSSHRYDGLWGFMSRLPGQAVSGLGASRTLPADRGCTHRDRRDRPKSSGVAHRVGGGWILTL